MVALREGSFLDDGILPMRSVTAVCDGFAATVAQGAPAMRVWNALDCITNMRKAKVQLNLCRGYVYPSEGAQAAAQPGTCSVVWC